MKVGFNDSENYWIGNDRLNTLTSTGNPKLRIDMWKNEVHHTSEYSTFSVGNESTGYALHQGGYSGTAGDCLYYNEGMQFSTYDRGTSMGCAQRSNGSWWYDSCTYAGMNNKIGHSDAFTWHCSASIFGTGYDNSYSLSLTQMWLLVFE